MNKLVKIKMHGIFGERIGKEFNLAVKSVPEAFHAINTITNGAWQRFQCDMVNDSLKYNVLVNEKELNLNELSDLDSSNVHKDESVDLVKNSELNLIPKGGLKSIDIVPSVEGQMGWIAATIALIVITTIITLALMKPPAFQAFKEIEDTKKGSSYLFDGPKNTVNEGGPIPLGYGRVVAGSQVIAQTYAVYHQDANDTSLDSNGTPTPIQGYDAGDEMELLENKGYPAIFNMASYLEAKNLNKPYLGEYDPNALGTAIGKKFIGL
tara:strand:+ start:403 stop:1200 length:798 start_codon:yes stop_codon:yes gene_type:complete